MDTKLATMKSLIVLVGIVVCLSCYGEAQGENMKYKDPKQPIEERVTDLLNRMNVSEKIGQMAQVDYLVYLPKEMNLLLDYIAADKVGPGIFNKHLFGSLLFNPKTTGYNPRQWIKAINSVQKEALGTRLGIPVIAAVDAVHGHSTYINSTIFPHNVGLGATRDADLLRRIGAATALEVRATGVSWALAPTVAVCRDPRWGRCFESYSEDPELVKNMTEIVTGLQGKAPQNHKAGEPYVANSKENVAACAKHYVADGGTDNGINEGNATLSQSDLDRIHMPSYTESIQKGVSTVMASYSSLNGIKMHANREYLTDVLKNKLGFQGFVVSDWMGIDKLTVPEGKNYTYSIEASINAGVDMVMIPIVYPRFIDGLSKLVEGGFVPMSRIDDAVRRILRVKFSLGLFENPYVDESLLDKLGSKEHRELAREAVRKSMVLLKNGKTEGQKLLPLPKSASKILVAGRHANDLGWQSGGFTLKLEGFNGNTVPLGKGSTILQETGTTILQAIQNTVDRSTAVVHEEVPSLDSIKKHGDAKYAIVVVGEKPYAESSGDNKTLALPDPGSDLIESVCGSIKCVVVMVTGRPLVIEPHLEKMDALAVAWLPGTEGQGVADVLFGDYPFTGKLPRTWMRNADQLPMNVGDKNYDPLFPFGFGLQT